MSSPVRPSIYRPTNKKAGNNPGQIEFLYSINIPKKSVTRYPILALAVAKSIARYVTIGRMIVS